ncbi:hypothetical protein GC194_03540 [bacterium]|nr:hypothetical protein [bacterium]
MIKTALIGTTSYGSLYLKNLMRLHEKGQVDLLAVVNHHPLTDPAAKAWLKTHKIAQYQDSKSLWQAQSQNIELCCIPTGIGAHHALTIEALAQNAHVLVEKPAAATPQQISAMAKAANNANKNVYVGYQNMYENETYYIKNLLLNGAIGEIESMNLLGLWPRATAYYQRNYWAGKIQNASEPIYDSVLHNAFAHFVNLMFFWSGASEREFSKPETVRGNMWRCAPAESFDSCSVAFATDNRPEILINISHSCRQNIDPKIKIVGSEGSLEWFGYYYILNNEKHQYHADMQTALEAARTNMFDHVIAHLNGEDVTVCEVADAASPTIAMHLMMKQLKIEIPLKIIETKTEFGTQLSVEGLDQRMIYAYQNKTIVGGL